MEKTKTKKKSGFRLPHLMFLMIGLLLFMSIMTYVIPAGTFATNPDGTLDGSKFSMIGHQTPVNPWSAMIEILTGLQNSSYVIATLLVNGGAIGVILGTKAIDRIVDFAIFRLKDKGIMVLIPSMVVMMGLVGAFGFGDHLVALVPVGVMLAKKLKVDPLCAVGTTSIAVLMGACWSPTTMVVPWTMMEVPLYSGFSVRFVMMLVMICITSLIVTRYALKIQKNPAKSLTGSADWLEKMQEEKNTEEMLKETSLKKTDILITLLFFLQYVVIVIGMSVLGMGRGIQPAVMIISCVICGLLAGWKLDDIGNTFAKGCGNMAFICFIIGVANAMSIVMTKGNILHTIVYVACLPLRSLSSGFAAVGISIVITFINLLIPSLSAKAAILIPIVKPMCEALQLTGQVGVQAFQIGDQFTNAITPLSGFIMGTCTMAGVAFDKYFKFAIRVITPLWTISLVLLYFLSMMGWTGL